ncbi:hypothetical protein [Teredinibacter purpureus]|uniref:hypothetical protein n=1 Tax=Teredinibacter purpureus TaxID=2731756 RepID=UPI0005F87982|nr:hypothetical protein [Teredinibacter purpureus]
MKILRAHHRASNVFIKVAVATCASIVIAACSEPTTQPARLYFAVKTIGPSVNIHSLDDNKVLTKHTDDSHWRDLSMDISPNGDIVFLSNRKDNFKVDLKKHTERLNVFLLPADSAASIEPGQTAAKPLQIINHPETEASPQFDPAGNAITYLLTRNGKTELLRKATPESEAETLMVSKKIHHYHWSPDSTTIAIGHSEDEMSYLSLLHVESKRVQHLVSLPLKAPSTVYEPNDDDPFMKHVAYAKFSPNGEYIAYGRNPNFRGSRQLRLFNIKTGHDKSLSPAGAHAQDGISWAANSQSLLFSALVDYKFYYNEETHKKVYEGGMQLFHHTIDKGTTQLSQGNHLFKNPTFSPSGNQIAYLYSEALGERVYSLRTMSLSGDNIEILHKKIAPSSFLIWK